MARSIKQEKVEEQINKLLKEGWNKQLIALKVSKQFDVRESDVRYVMYYMDLQKRWNSRKGGSDENSPGVSYRVIEISYLRTDCGGGCKDKRNYLEVENQREYEGVERRVNAVGVYD